MRRGIAPRLGIMCAIVLGCGGEGGSSATSDAGGTDPSGSPASSSTGDEPDVTSTTAAPDDTAASNDATSADATGVSDTSAPTGCPAGDGTFAVSDVQGSVQDGLSITVCGDGFGALGPTILFFDDMESGQADAPIGSAPPAIGEWLMPGSRYVGDAARSGSLAMLLTDTELTGGGGVSSVVGLPDRRGPLGLRLFDEVFMSISIRDLGDFPGNDSGPMQFSSDSSAKDVWMMFGDRGDNHEYSCSQGECNGNDFVFATHTGGGSFKHDGNNTVSSWWLPDFWQFEAWNVMSTHFRVDADDPYGDTHGVFEHVSQAGGYLRDEYTGPLLADLEGIPPAWDRVKIGGWYRQAGDVRRVADDLYIAIGPGAAARVEIADAALIEDATKIAISTAHDWSPSTIEATVRLGDLDAQAEDLWLFVVTADGERSPGYPLAP